MFIEDESQPMEMGPTNLVELLTDWFETTEEVDLGPADHGQIQVVAEIFTSFRDQVLTMGICEEDFEDWLRMDVLDHWSVLMEDMEDMDSSQSSLDQFVQFVNTGEQRLFLQLLKRCSALSEQMTA